MVALRVGISCSVLFCLASSPKFGEKLSITFCLTSLIFPGYFLFHIIYARGLFPYMPWLACSMVVVVLCFFYITAALVIRGRLFFERSSVFITALVFFCILSIFSVSMLNHIFNPSEYIVGAGLSWSMMVVLGLVSMFFLGLIYKGGQSSSLAILAVFLQLSMVVASVALHDPLYGTVHLASYSAAWVDKSKLATYQGLAMSLFYFTLLTMPFIRAPFIRFLTLVLCAFGLYFIGARTEMVFVLICFALFLMCRVGVVGNFFLAGTVVLAFMIPVFFDMGPFEVSDRYSVSQEDASYLERSLFFRGGINSILESPIMGDYLGQVRDYGSQGAYIHNLLSVWQQYGLAAFLSYSFLCLVSILVVMVNWSSIKSCPELELLLYLSVTTFVAVLFAKSIAWPMPGLSWGIACKVISKKNVMSSFK